MTTIPALTDLPQLDDVWHLDSELATAFRRDGHVCVRGVASADEVAAYLPVLRELALANVKENRPLEERGTYGRAFLQVPNLWRYDERAARFALARRFGSIAAQLLGVDAVRMYRDQALFKEAGGGRTPWHQDQVYWPLDTDSTITMWMPLVDVPADIGTMTFASGSQLLGSAGAIPPSDASDDVFNQLIEERQLVPATHGALVAGDTTWHNGWTMHSAPENPTGVLRAVMTVTYFADGARVTEPSSRYQEWDWKAWLDSRPPGSLADSELNPVVYSSGAMSSS